MIVPAVKIGTIKANGSGPIMNPEIPPYSGMVTNERLYSAGILDLFDRATKSRNRQEMIELLSRVDLSQAEAAEIADAILSKRRSYFRFSKRTLKVLVAVIVVVSTAAMARLPQHWPILLMWLVAFLVAYRFGGAREW